MRRDLFITAANRPAYFRETMDTWRQTRGFYDWPVTIRLEPTPFVDEHVSIIKELEHENLKIVVNPEVYGVLHHPWVGFDALFQYSNFVVRAEDDLIVSEDILEFFEWASEEYRLDGEIGAVIGYSGESGPSDEVHRTPKFSPWVWGTWHDRWKNVIRDTWDHDYSTNDGTWMSSAGWDWNLDKRVFPSLGLKTITPLASRVDNIGIFGVHGNLDNFVQSPSFTQKRDSISGYYERGRA